MSVKHSIKDTVPPYILSDWDQVLLGNAELFTEMTDIHLPALLRDARQKIEYERRLGNLPPDVLHAEELVGETLILAWQGRHGRSKRALLKNWLLEMQKQALANIIQEERKFYDPIAVSLEAPVPSRREYNDENEFYEWVEPPPAEQWADIIPDTTPQPFAA